MMGVVPGKSGVEVRVVCYGTDQIGSAYDKEMSCKPFIPMKDMVVRFSIPPEILM